MIKLSQLEKDFLANNLELDPKEIKELISNISNDDASEKIRELCIDKLDYCGYDDNYELNNIGKELNKLIDKLFLG